MKHTGTELQKIRRAFANAIGKSFDRTNQFLGEISDEEVLPRRALIELLTTKMEKLRQDMSAQLTLLDTHHVGSARAMRRVCQENVFYMLMLSLGDPEHDLDSINIVQRHRPIKDWTRYKKQLADFLDLKDELNMTASGVEAIEKSMTLVQRQIVSLGNCPDIPAKLKHLVHRRFAEQILYICKRLASRGMLDTAGLACATSDYWFDCEAVHSGEASEWMYRPHDYGAEQDVNIELTALSLCQTLDGLFSLAIGSIVIAYGQSMNRPPEFIELTNCANQIADVLSQYSCSGAS